MSSAVTQAAQSMKEMSHGHLPYITMKPLFCTLMIAPLMCGAQTPAWEWVKAQAGYAYDIVALPSSGGYFFGSANPADGFFGLPLQGDGNFMARFDADGNPVWAQSMDSCYVLRAKYHNDGLHLVAQCYGSELNWGGFTMQLVDTAYNLVIARLDLSGTPYWARLLDSPAWSWLGGFDVNGEGESFIGMTCYSAVTLEGDTILSGPWQYAGLLKFSATGDLAWARTVGCEDPGYSSATALAADDNGGCILAATIYVDSVECADFSIAGVTIPSGEPSVVAKFGPDGEEMWASIVSGIVYALASAGPLGVAIAGMDDTLSINGFEMTQAEEMNAFIAWLNSDGSPGWARSTAHCSSWPDAFAIAQRLAIHSNNVVVVGSGRGLEIALDGGIPPNGPHTFLSIFDFDGNALGSNVLSMSPVNSIAGPDDRGLAIDESGSVYLTGVVKPGFVPEKLSMVWDGLLTPLPSLTALFLSRTARIPVGVPELGLMELELSPNPAAEWFRLSGTKANGPFQVLLRSQDGKSIKEVTLTSLEELISVSGLSPGMYCISVKSADLQAHSRIIVMDR